MGTKKTTLDFDNIQKSIGEVFPVDCKIDLFEIDVAFGTIEINGEIKNTSGAVTVNLNFNGMYKTACDRCLEAVAIPLNATISTIITGKESKDDSVSIIDGKIDLQKTAYDALCLEIPIQVLCKDDCKGLCFECGQNLNVKQCECDK